MRLNCNNTTRQHQKMPVRPGGGALPADRYRYQACHRQATAIASPARWTGMAGMPWPAKHAREIHPGLQNVPGHTEHCLYRQTFGAYGYRRGQSCSNAGR